MRNAATVRYEEKHREEILAKQKAKNWYFDKEERKVIRERYTKKITGRTTLIAKKSRCKRLGIPFDLTVDWYNENFPKGCAVTGVEEVISYYSELMRGKDIDFTCSSFENISPIGNKDVVYLDPPYTNTKALYFGNISFDGLLSWIDKLPCSWFMNINGVNSTDNEEAINIEYTCREVLSSGNSSFSRMKGKSVDVGEYFYYKLV